MAKKVEEKPEVKAENKPEEVKKVEEKVEEKVEAANKEIKAEGGRQNIVNYVEKPRVEDPDFDFKAWAIAVDEKLEKLLGGKPKEEPKVEPKIETPPEPPKKVHWLDREII